MNQVIKNIDIEDLVLWTENPRDPIDKNAKDQDIVNKAWEDKQEKWSLKKLAREMKTHYDFSELPTIVYHGKKPVIYDGNRRMILAKIKHSCVEVDGAEDLKLPDIPSKIPCNVCSKEIAILNIYRKHANSGSWSPLDRDYFVYKFLSQPKSMFLKLDEATGLIRNNPHLNKGFVKKEIFNQERLHEFGFDTDEDHFLSKHSVRDTKAILNDISSKVATEIITTRKYRGKAYDALDKTSRNIIEKNISKNAKSVRLSVPGLKGTSATNRQTRRTKNKQPEIFGGKLNLKSGVVNDLYRDIVDLNNFYQKNKQNLSPYFPGMVRMSLRLLCEASAGSQSFDKFVKTNFKAGKKELDQDQKTTLSSHNVNENTIIQLLHIGAHRYHAANDYDKTLAMTLIIGKIIQNTHGS